MTSTVGRSKAGSAIVRGPEDTERQFARQRRNRTASRREHAIRWITRENIKVDRVACPWLIKRFVDPQAEFLFVPESELLQAAQQHQAVPYDAPRIPQIKLNHRG